MLHGRAEARLPDPKPVSVSAHVGSKRGEDAMRNLFTILTVTFLVLGASTVSAQSYPERACAGDVRAEHAHTTCEARGSATSCDAIQRCVCDAGYHMDGLRDNGDPNCVRAAPSYGSYSDPLCALGAVRGADGECMCPDTLGARRHRTLTIVSRSYAESIADQIENFDSVRRGGRVVALQVCIDPLATGTAPGSLNDALLSALDQRVRILCGSADGASDEQVLADCRETREMITRARSGAVTIHHGDRDYTVQEFVDGPLATRFGDIEQRLTALEETVAGHTTAIADLDRRVGDLEDRTGNTPDGPNSFALTLGAMAELGFATYGPMTLSGDAMVTGLFRPGTQHFDVYLRLRGGGAFTGWSTGSAHIAAGAGLSFYLDSHLRRGLTFAVGAWAEDLLDLGPDGPGQVRGDTIGFAAGGELNLGIPVGDSVHIELGAALGYSERYGVAPNGADLSVFPGFDIAPHVGVTVQLF